MTDTINYIKVDVIVLDCQCFGRFGQIFFALPPLGVDFLQKQDISAIYPLLSAILIIYPAAIYFYHLSITLSSLNMYPSLLAIYFKQLYIQIFETFN